MNVTAVLSIAKLDKLSSLVLLIASRYLVTSLHRQQPGGAPDTATARSPLDLPPAFPGILNRPTFMHLQEHTNKPTNKHTHT